MKKQKTLSNFEGEIMDILWDEPHRSVRDVLENLPQPHKKAYTTVQTYLERLIKKGFLSKQKIGMVNFYHPVISRETVQKNETRHFINKTFQGSLSKLAAFLFDSENLSTKDLQSIKALIREKEHDND